MRRKWTKRNNVTKKRKNGGNFTTPKKSRRHQQQQPKAPTKRKIYPQMYKTHVFEANEIKKIGKDSVNGFVLKVKTDTKPEIERLVQKGRKDNEYRVLKSSQDENKKESSQLRDSLIYEYRVGLFLNKYLHYFPCFVKTYNLYKYNYTEDGRHSKFLLKKRLEKEKLLNLPDPKNLKRITDSISMTNFTDESYYDCDNKNDYALELQYVPGTTLGDWMDNTDMRLSKNKSLLAKIMFQIYGPLHALSDIYTHRDLHVQNVMLVQLDRPIGFHYTCYGLDDEDEEKPTVVSFNCDYLVKLIDYGRSHIPSTSKIVDEYENLNERDREKFEAVANHCGLLPLLYDGHKDTGLFKHVYGMDYPRTSWILYHLMGELKQEAINTKPMVSIDLHTETRVPMKVEKLSEMEKSIMNM